MSRKRANGEGSLSQRKNGTWQCQIMVGWKADGTRDIRTFTGKTQKEAKAKRDEFMRKRKDGQLTGEDMRFDEWADIWFANHKDNIKPTTQESYKYTLRILKDHFGRRMLADIRAMDVEQFLKKAEGVRPLSHLTGGIHLHTVRCPDEETLKRVTDALNKEGFLLEE